MAIVEGETITLEATFTDDSGTATSPSTPVEITVRKPDGTVDVDSATVSEGSTGEFSYTYTTSDPGLYNYKYVSADGAIEQGTFYVYADNT